MPFIIGLVKLDPTCAACVLYVIILQNSTPEFESVTDNCTYRFLWSTYAGCPSPVHIQPVIGENCTVTDPTSGMMNSALHLLETKTQELLLCVIVTL